MSMAKSGIGRFLFPAVIFFLIAAAAILGILQFRWVSRASEAEERRLRSGLQLSVHQALENAFDEVMVLLSIAYLTPEESSVQDIGRLKEALELWRSNVSHPDLLTAAYFLNWETDNQWDRVFPLDEGIVDPGADMPVSLMVLLESVIPKGVNPRTWDQIRGLNEALLEEGMLLLPVPGSVDNRGGTDEHVFRALVIDLDIEDYFTEVVPDHLVQSLENHPFRLTETKTNLVLAVSAAEIPAVDPEVEMSLTGNPLSGRRPDDTSGTDPRNPPDMRYPIMRLWLRRPPAFDRSPEPRPPVETAQTVKLEVFYPGGSLSGMIAARRTTNLVISVGVIVLMAASLIILFGLYSRTGRLRERENEFIASVSHDLRTPISVIQAASDNLVQGIISEPEGVNRYGKIIKREAGRLAQHVEGILLYSGLQSGRRNGIQATDVDLPGLIKDVVESLEGLAEQNHVTVQISTEAIPDKILSDAMGLRLILENLLVNALRHGIPDGGIEAHIVRLIVRRLVLGRLLLCVEDEGDGVPARDVQRIFNPFFRRPDTVKRRTPGSGLGLHLVRRISNFLGGSVSLESPYSDVAGNLHTGCRFTVNLPLQEGS